MVAIIEKQLFLLKAPLIKDEYNKSDSRIIYAKKGYFSEANNQKILVLNDGKILNINKGK